MPAFGVDGVVAVAVSAVRCRRVRSARYPAQLLAAVLVVLAGLASAGSALAAEVPVAGAIEVDAQADPGPNDPGRCIAIAFLRFPAIKGATSYSAVVDNAILGHQRFGGPPFQDVYQVRAYTVLTFAVGAGRHQLALGSYSTGTGCGDARAGAEGRFALVSLTATVPGENWIAGAVRDGQGKGVAGVRVSVGSRTVATDAFGGYRVKVEDGTYAVSAPGPYCVKGLSDCKRAKTVEVPPAQTVDFVAPGEHRLKGTVRESECEETSCTQAPLSGVVVRATPKGGGAPGEATTGDDGTYSLTLPEGSYVVVARLDERRFTPKSRTVDLSSDVEGVDFETCPSAGQARRLAKDPQVRPCDLLVRVEFKTWIAAPDFLDPGLGSETPAAATNDPGGWTNIRGLWPPTGCIGATDQEAKRALPGRSNAYSINAGYVGERRVSYGGDSTQRGWYQGWGRVVIDLVVSTRSGLIRPNSEKVLPTPGLAVRRVRYFKGTSNRIVFECHQGRFVPGDQTGVTELSPPNDADPTLGLRPDRFRLSLHQANPFDPTLNFPASLDLFAFADSKAASEISNKAFDQGADKAIDLIPVPQVKVAKTILDKLKDVYGLWRTNSAYPQMDGELQGVFTWLPGLPDGDIVLTLTWKTDRFPNYGFKVFVRSGSTWKPVAEKVATDAYRVCCRNYFFDYWGRNGVERIYDTALRGYERSRGATPNEGSCTIQINRDGRRSVPDGKQQC